MIMATEWFSKLKRSAFWLVVASFLAMVLAIFIWYLGWIEFYALVQDRMWEIIVSSIVTGIYPLYPKLKVLLGNRSFFRAFKSHINEDCKSTIEALKTLAEKYKDDLSGFRSYIILDKDLLEAKQWYKGRLEALTELANNEDPNAMLELGLTYKQGKGVERDKAKAAELFDKRIKALTKRAENGDTEAMWKLAWIYRDGGEEDAAIAQKWNDKRIQALTEQAEKGNPKAMRELAMAYYCGSV